MKLLIVESPGKVKKIQSFLGGDFKVMASVGHVRDLPLKEIGVAAPAFKPNYQATDRGKKIIVDLKKAAANAEMVYLATDPDREGEAIAWHLQEVLKLKNPLRVTYTEITEKAVKEALNSARSIDGSLVEAQEARRVLDRLVGYLVSPVLSNAVGGKLSAGRVQSPALKLVVEREQAICAFKETVHYSAELTFQNAEETWKAQWLPKDGWLEKDMDYFLDQRAAEKVAAIDRLEVVNYEEKESQVAPPPPFTTSSLQQAASVALKMSPKKTMELAQKLYEAGHITYTRTDSPNLSDEAITAIRRLADQKNWPLPDKPRTWQSKAGAQEAHEAIRPTHFEVDVASEDAEQAALYNLIRLRAIASQLDVAIYSGAMAQLEGTAGSKKAIFQAKGRRLIHYGWRVLMPSGDQTDEDAPTESGLIPKLEKGQLVQSVAGEVLTKKTQPPSRFSEAGLIKELENRGIGRPSTYAAILDNIQSRNYVALDNKKRLVPTDIGCQIIRKLQDHFSFLDYAFTRDLEADLDEIAQGRKQYLAVVTGVHDCLQAELKIFSADNTFLCEACGKPLRHVVKKGVFDFWGCSGFPDCNETYLNDNGKPGAKQERKPKPEHSEFICPQCGAFLIRHCGEKNGKAYDFYGCAGYPKCSVSYSTKDGKPDIK